MNCVSWKARQVIQNLPDGPFRVRDLFSCGEGNKAHSDMGSFMKSLEYRGMVRVVKREYCRINGSGAIINSWQLTDMGLKIKREG